tara:strand:- start:764 stop:1420 length:657 start_codon:yes stop_codon:yes gene_type:complete
MNKRAIIALILFIFLTTITFNHKLAFTKLNLSEIKIENNKIITDEEILKLLRPFYNKNLLFVRSTEIEKALMKNSFIKSFNLKKKYPNTIKLKIFEHKPIVILFDKKKKFYLNEKIGLMEFKSIKDYKDIPIVIGNKNEFKILYENLKKIKFPFNIVKKFTLYESKRWDLLTVDEKTIKLPNKNYTKNLNNYLELKEIKSFKNYFIFDYRIKDQLILK